MNRKPIYVLMSVAMAMFLCLFAACGQTGEEDSGGYDIEKAIQPTPEKEGSDGTLPKETKGEESKEEVVTTICSMMPPEVPKPDEIDELYKRLEDFGDAVPYGQYQIEGKIVEIKDENTMVVEDATGKLEVCGVYGGHKAVNTENVIELFMVGDTVQVFLSLSDYRAETNQICNVEVLSRAIGEPAEGAELSAAEKLLPSRGRYRSVEKVVLYLHLYGKLPSNYMTLSEAKGLGWKEIESVSAYRLNGAIGGDVYENSEGFLPKNTTYKECDIGINGSRRLLDRLIYSAGGRYYLTDSEYTEFKELAVNDNNEVVWYDKERPLDCRRMTTVEDVHAYFKEVFNFPDWYGENLDALYDCLSCTKQEKLILKNSAELDALGEWKNKLLNVLSACCQIVLE